MLMFDDMGGWGVNEKITDYVDMGRGLQKLICFALKTTYALGFLDKMFIFLRYFYMSTILDH